MTKGRIRYITRPAHRREEVLTELRQQIVTGQHSPGGRLPTRRELEKSLGASRLTVQAALDRLAADGFVEARGRHGTFVTARPPHINRFALVLPPSSPFQERSQFIDALHQEVALIEGESDYRFAVYSATATDPGGGYGALADEVRSHRLAGIIYVSASERFGLAGLDDVDIPMVAINSGMGVAATLVPNYASFYDLATAYAAARGRRRVAVLTLGGAFESMRAAVEPFLTARALEFRRSWFQSLSSGHAGWGRNLVELLMDRPVESRPNLLIIADDNLVTEATEELLAQGIRIPDALTVIAHTNFPWPTPARVPVVRLGFDVGEILRACVARIEALRRGETVDTVTYLPAVFAKGEND